MYALFAAPPDRDLEWQEDGVAGISRFLARVHRLSMKYADVTGRDEATPPSAAGDALLRKAHQTIAKITEDFKGRWHFNTCIAAIMILVNEISAAEPAMELGEIPAKTVASVFLILNLLLAPFAPFLAAELWERAGYEGEIFRAAWPEADAELARESEIEIPVQVNGKLVTVVRVAADADEETIKAAALGDEKVSARIAGKTVVKTIVVKGKLVNLVVK